MNTLSPRYDPKKVEPRIYRYWLKEKLFEGKIVKGKKPFVIVIPPPNITGSLHMGHALNNTLQDILIRKSKMMGRPTLWVPGTDHAGIATQFVVERELQKDGKTRFDLGREKFIKRVEQWKEKYGGIILDQLKKLGCALDWSRTTFTLDRDYAKAVETAFQHFYQKGLIYQGERLVNWCPRCGTALSDLEVQHRETQGKLFFIRYPLKQLTVDSRPSTAQTEDLAVVGRPKAESQPPDHITVATTRPETMLGDTAVAVHPEDKRYQTLVGKMLRLPLTNREIPVIADTLVDPRFGSGAVKVTPAHDLLDFEIAQRHQLEPLKVIDEYGKMTEDSGRDFAGLSRQVARDKVIERLRTQGLLDKVEDYQYPVPHCYRCNTILEKLLSKQWFLKMDKLKEPAIKVVKEGKIKFVPARWTKVYLDWMEKLEDWNISRQIWWGHRLPVWKPELKTKNAKLKTEFYVGDNPPKGYKQVDDVLDTWFSSALWPLAVFKWPRKTTDLQYFYPTTVLSTARDIIYLWVARMIMFGLEFSGKIPFSTVLIHPTVLTLTGKRMSKSLGTGVDPLDLIEEYGADAVRFGLAWQVTGNQDLRFDENALISARNFANKIWNITRFILMNLESSNVKAPISNEAPNPKTENDKKILEKLKQINKSTNQHLNQYRFGQAAQDLYHFIWHEFADKYLEQSKVQLKNPKLKNSTLGTLLYVLGTSLKLLHPFMPYLTEELWNKISHYSLPTTPHSILNQPWPEM